MRQIYWGLDEVRREVQREVDKQTCIHMKRSKKLLWKSPSKLSEEGRQKVEKLLQNHPRLKEAYGLKNRLDEWLKTSNAKTAGKGLYRAK